MYIKYNDYELLYLIGEGSDVAYKGLFDKYRHLIRQKMIDFKLKEKYYDDYMQEGLISLDIASKKYDEYRGKTFTKFFELILVRKFQKLLNSEKEYFFNVTLVEYPDMLREDRYDALDIKQEFSEFGFSDLEVEILYYVSLGFKPREIVSVTKYDRKKVYNALSRVKLKSNK